MRTLCAVDSRRSLTKSDPFSCIIVTLSPCHRLATYQLHLSRLACRRRLHNNLSSGEKVTSRNIVSVCVTGLVFYSSELHKVLNNVGKY